MRSCESMREDFSALLDGELDPFQRTAIEEHLSQCSECLRALGGMKKVDDLYRALAPVSAPPDFEERLKQRLQPRVRLFAGRKTAVRRIWPLAAAAGLVAILSVFLMRMQSPAPDRLQLTRAQQPPSTSADRPAFVPDAGAPRTQGPPTAAADLMTKTDMARPMPPSAPLASAESGTSADAHSATLPEQRAAEAPAPLARAERIHLESRRDAVAVKDAGRTHAPVALRSMQEPPRRQVGDRAFALVAGVWREQGYAGEPVTPLLRGSEEFRALCDRHDDLPAIAALGPTVIFRLEERWRQIEPAADGADH